MFKARRGWLACDMTPDPAHHHKSRYGVRMSITAFRMAY